MPAKRLVFVLWIPKDTFCRTAFCPAAVQGFRMGKALFFMSSKGDVKEFFGMGVSEPDQSSVCFLWVPKVT